MHSASYQVSGNQFKSNVRLSLTFLQSNSLCAIHEEGDPGVFEGFLDIAQCPVERHRLFLFERGDGSARALSLVCQVILRPAQPSPGRPALLRIYHLLTVIRINSVHSGHFVHFMGIPTTRKEAYAQAIPKSHHQFRRQECLCT